MKNQQSEEMDNKLMDALCAIAEIHDREYKSHVGKIKGYTEILLKHVCRCCPEYNLTEIKMDKIVQASALLDIGMLAIPDNIRLKSGKLTADEFEFIKLHTVKGCEIIDTISFMNDKELLNYCYEICHYHHERYDGTGYPDGLKGEEIPVSAQVVSLASVYETLTSAQIYKYSLSSREAFRMILNGECGVFSPKLLECLKLAKDEFEEFKQSFV